jgi:hypothetical protein
MKKYSANNSRIGLDIFTAVVIILGIMAILLIEFKANSILIFLSIAISLVTIYFAIKIYRHKVFDISFSENEIVVEFRHKSEKLVYSYNDIVSIEYRSGGGHSLNIFIFYKDNSLFKYKTQSIASGDEYVEFIKQAKTFNKTFKTYIWPKSDSLHRKLRQEILNVEY